MNKNTFGFLISLVFVINQSFAQVGINTIEPHSSSALDIVSQDKGLLIPRLEGNRIANMIGMANGLLVYAISTFDNINSIGFWYYNGTNWIKLGKGENLYENDGTLLSNRVITMNNYNLNFSSTSGKFIVNAPFETKKALFAKPIRLHPVSSSITWLTDDVVILLQSGHSGSISLPNASQNANRMVAISNRSGSSRPFSFVDNSESGIYNYENANEIKNNSVVWFLSDGISWNILSDIPNENLSNSSFAPNIQLVSKVGQSSNFYVEQPILNNNSYVDILVTTTGNQFPYLVNLKSNFVNGYIFNSDIVTINQSPATIRLYASGSPISIGGGNDSFVFTCTNYNGSSQLTASILLSGLPILNSISSQPSAAYGLRLLKSNYIGPLIRVFKSESSVISELDIAFLPNGDLDVNSLIAFANGGTVAIKTWYDQSGNANNIALTNSNFAIAPIIVNNGNLITINNKPAANFVDFGFKSSGAFPSMTIGSCSSVFDVTAAPNGVNKRLLAPTINFSGSTGASNYSISATGTKYVNGISSTTLAMGKTTFLVNFSTISTYGGFFGNVGTSSQSNAFPGKISELILFSTNLDTNEINLLNTNQINYYGL